MIDRRATPLPRQPAPRIVELQPHEFHSGFKERPAGPVRVGLRLPSERVNQDARALAAKDVQRDYAEAASHGHSDLVHDAMVESYNALVMVNVLAHSMCVPDDVATAYFQSAPNDMVMIALRSETIARLWEELGALRAELNPTSRLATDEEVAAVGVDPAVATNKFRRLLAQLHEEMETMTA